MNLLHDVVVEVEALQHQDQRLRQPRDVRPLLGVHLRAPSERPRPKPRDLDKISYRGQYVLDMVFMFYKEWSLGLGLFHSALNLAADLLAEVRVVALERLALHDRRQGGFHGGLALHLVGNSNFKKLCWKVYACLKKTYVRQVVLDKWFPLRPGARAPGSPRGAGRAARPAPRVCLFVLFVVSLFETMYLVGCSLFFISLLCVLFVLRLGDDLGGEGAAEDAPQEALARLAVGLRGAALIILLLLLLIIIIMIIVMLIIKMLIILMLILIIQ